MMTSCRGNEIVFFDLETNVPKKSGQKFWVLEFGAIVICPRKLVELESYCTLIRPGDLLAVGTKSGRRDGITRGAVEGAPSFEEVSDKIFEILNGRIWAGHNIQRFDCVRLKEAYATIGKPAPVPVGMVDSLGVLTAKFGRRAGNMKMASLAAYFGLGEQKHRSIDDVRMNLEVLKHCATVLFLESALPGVFSGDKLESRPSMTTRSKSRISDTGKSTSSMQDNRRQWRNESTMMMTRSRSNGAFPFSHKEESIADHQSSRKRPASTLGNNRRVVPYPPCTNFGKMTEKVKNILCNAQSRTPLNHLLKHSHSLLR